MAEQLEKSMEELKSLQAHLINSAKMTSVGSLATGIAHEINNPVFAISGRADLLIKGADKHLASEKATEYVRNIKEMAGRISSITANLMEYSQPSEERKDVVLSEVVEVAVELMGKKGKSLRIIREYEDAPIVNVVPSRLQQVFVNLLTNSAEAIADWGSVTIGCKIEGENAVAYVKDDGTGMTDEVKERLFEPFVSSKEIDNRVGMGLGLYTCHQIVDAHGGEIIVSSELGSGTIVAVKLPLTEESPRQAEENTGEMDLPMAVGMSD